MAKQYPSPPDLTIDLDKSYTATLDTNHGEIVIDLDAARSPLTVNNFVFLARDGFYDGVIFHRTIPGFMIQGGDPTGTGRGGPGYRFADEPVRRRYTRGTLAMANAGPDTNGSQFFLVFRDSQFPPSYTVFGTIDEAGLAVLDKIAAEGNDNSNPAGGGAPNKDVTIEKVTVS